MTEIPENFCPAPWSRLITNFDGSALPCWAMQKTLFAMPNVHREGGAQIWNGEFFRSLRQVIRKGQWSPHCLGCRNKEDAGLPSERKKRNQEFSSAEAEFALSQTLPDGTFSEPVKRFELYPSNRCNFRCVICGPESSSAWGEELSRVRGESEHVEKDRVRHSKSKVFTDRLVQEIRSGEFLAHEILFSGGEPLFSEDHIHVMEALLETKQTNVRLIYVTSFYALDPRVLDYWNKFDSVSIHISADGVAERYNYLRYPGTWDSFVQNLRLLDANRDENRIKLSIHYDISMLSVFHIVEDSNFYSREFPNIEFKVGRCVVEKPYLSIQNFPSAFKQLVQAELHDSQILNPKILPEIEKVIAHMHADEGDAQRYIRQLLIMFRRIEQWRHLEWQKVFPELLPLTEHSRNFTPVSPTIHG